MPIDYAMMLLLSLRDAFHTMLAMIDAALLFSCRRCRAAATLYC